MWKFRLLLLLVLGGILASGCASSPSSHEDPQAYEYLIPAETGDGWQTASLTDVGFDPTPFSDLMSDLAGMSGHQIHSVLLIREGKLAFEEYFAGPKFSLAQYTGGFGFDRDDTHNLASVTKSFTTTLVGMAIDQGHIPSVHSKVFDFFPEHSELVDQDPRRGDMTLEHLLLMTSGIRWLDQETYPYADPRNDLIRMWNSDDPIGYALSREIYGPPGATFQYCNANTNILGEIVRRATGARMDDFSGDHLFGPLGVSEFQWQMMPNEVVFASGDLRLRPRDMAKFGQLFLNQGRWEEVEIVSEGWVEAATKRRVEPYGPHGWADGYGYGWWHWDLDSGGRIHEAYLASGWGGQWIIVVPEHDMVVVSTAGNYFQNEVLPIQVILTDYVLPALLPS